MMMHRDPCEGSPRPGRSIRYSDDRGCQREAQIERDRDCRRESHCDRDNRRESHDRDRECRRESHVERDGRRESHVDHPESRRESRAERDSRRESQVERESRRESRVDERDRDRESRRESRIERERESRRESRADHDGRDRDSRRQSHYSHRDRDDRELLRPNGGRSSVSSQESDNQATVMSMSKRWTTLETVGRCMFLFSVAFFIVGVLITVFGFSNTGIDRSQQIPLQILGPTCLAMTVVMWIIGCIFSRLWNLEWKRQQHAFELRDRVQLHALAMDILNNPVISPGMLQDPSLRRQLLLKLRAQKTLDLSSEMGPESRRSSRALSMDSRRRYSSVQYEKLLQAERKKSAVSCDLKPTFELPGIQISRIETLDFGDSRGSLASCSTRSRNSRQYIIIHSDVASDFSRLSCPSDYSLAGSRSSRSRGSRASSQLSSRIWDFSPRESDWDADISLGSRESQLSVLRQDWGGGTTDYYREDCLSPMTPRKLSVVTFDTSPTFRRHSSPVFPNRRKESGPDCTCNRNDGYPPSIMRTRDMSCHSLRFSDGVRIVESTARKRSADLISCRSLRIQEDERENAPQQLQPEPRDMREPPPPPPRDPAPQMSDSQRGSISRPPLRRNNTDDSEVERRVARLFKEIEYSVSESVDDSKVHSFSSDYDFYSRKVEAKEAQTQTMTESEMKLLEVGESDGRNSETSRKNSSANSWSETSHHSQRDSHESENSEEPKPRKKKKSRSFEKTLSTISNALSSLGRRSSSSSEKKSKREYQSIPRALLLQGLSFEKEEGAIKSPPPTYEDVVNKNL